MTHECIRCHGAAKEGPTVDGVRVFLCACGALFGVEERDGWSRILRDVRLPVPPSRQWTLNPGYEGDDPVARRFAGLEVD